MLKNADACAVLGELLLLSLSKAKKASAMSGGNTNFVYTCMTYMRLVFTSVCLYFKKDLCTDM